MPKNKRIVNVNLVLKAVHIDGPVPESIVLTPACPCPSASGCTMLFEGPWGLFQPTGTRRPIEMSRHNLRAIWAEVDGSML